MISDRERESATYIRGVTDELTKEDLLVAVECVDDETEKLVNLSLESKGLGVSHRCELCVREEGGEGSTMRTRVSRGRRV